MAEFDLEAIRTRDAAAMPFDEEPPPEPHQLIQCFRDRRTLLAAYDELLRVNRDCVANFDVLKADYDVLAEAARKVTCARCGGSGEVIWPSTARGHGIGGQMITSGACPNCTDLRRILEGER